jgi:hypothetical protein
MTNKRFMVSNKYFLVTNMYILMMNEILKTAAFCAEQLQPIDCSYPNV